MTIWMNFGDPRIPERIWNMVVPEPNSGCWIHVGRVVAGGYTQTGLNGKRMVSHRMMYIAAGGELPEYHEEDLELDHYRCSTPSCCNPAHVRPEDHRTNTLRGNTVTGANATATHCIHGHEFTPENTRMCPRVGGAPYRHCRACARARRIATRAETAAVV